MIRTILLIGAVIACAHSETVDWTLGRAIEVPVHVSLPTKPLPRTIILPGGAVTEIPSSWFEDQVEVRWIRNTVSVKLKDPVFSGTIQVYDDKGSLYLFNIRAARPEEQVDETLILRPAADGTQVGPDGIPHNSPMDSDGAVTEMMVAMVNGRPTSSIVGAVQYRMEDKKIIPGTRITEDDTIAWYLAKVWQGPRLRGYETVFVYKGKKTLKLPVQSLWAPGWLAVYAANQVIYDRNSPDKIELMSGQAIKMLFVVE